MASDIQWEGLHFAIGVRRPVEGVVVLMFRGTDVGELGDRPFAELERDLAPGLPIELFIDARATRAASLDVSQVWARWMAAHRTQLHRVHLLCGSDLLVVTARFVAGFSGLGDRLRVYRDPEPFDRLLAIVEQPLSP